MTLETQDIAAIINATRESGGIPVSVNLIATTEWTQYLILMVITAASGFFVFVLMWDGYIKPIIGKAYLNVVLYRIKKITGRRALIIKHTNSGLFEQSMIDIHTLNGLEKALKSFKGEPFDLILHTPGGYVFYAQLLSKIIRNYQSEVRAIVPFYAMSGGTILALSCDKIIMGDFACLGPVDPQLGGLFSYGSARSWKEVIRRKGRRASDSSIQMAYSGDQYTRTIKQDIISLLRGHISDDSLLESTATFLTDGGVEHALQLDRSKLSDIGISTQKIDVKVQALLSKVLSSNWIEGEFWY